MGDGLKRTAREEEEDVSLNRSFVAFVDDQVRESAQVGHAVRREVLDEISGRHIP